VSSELVEHRGQPERNLRVLETGVLSLPSLSRSRETASPAAVPT
jgi:hypothetical protein